MADQIKYASDNTLSALALYFKNKIPTVDSTITQNSNNPVSSAAVYAFIAEKIADIGSVSLKMVNSLPENGDGKYIYLVPKSSSESQNSFDEYLWYNSAWEMIGTTDIDLSDYLKASEMHEITREEAFELLEIGFNS